MLLAVDKFKSKRKVAEQTNTSIDTVNKYLRNLEQNLGLQLTINSTNGCKLTPRAQVMVAKLQSIAEILDQIYNQRAENNRYKGDVSVRLPLTVNTIFFLNDIGSFFDAHPDVKINLITTVESPKYEESGADLAIVFNFDEKSKYYSLIYQKPLEFGLFASKEYINKYGYPENLDDLIKNHRLTNQTEEYDYIPEWKEILSKAKHYTFASNSDYAVSEIIRNGWGIGLMPYNPRLENLVKLDNFKFDSKLTLYLLVNNNTKNIPRVKAVTEYYRNLINNI